MIPGQKTYKSQCLDFVETIHMDTAYPLIFCHFVLEFPIDTARLKEAVQKSSVYVPEILCIYNLQKGCWIEQGYTADDIVCESFDYRNWDFQHDVQLKIWCTGRNDILTIAISHILSDARGFLQYLYLLADLYNGNAPSCDLKNCRNIKPIVDQNHKRTETNTDSIPFTALPFDQTESDHHILCVTISPDHFASIRQKAKKFACTVNDMIMTAYARTVTSILHENSVMIPCPIDLRRMQPNFHRLGVANMTGMLNIPITVNPSDTFDVTLVQVHKEIRLQIANKRYLDGLRELQFIYRKLPDSLVARLLRKSYCIVPILYSNVGVIDHTKLFLHENSIQHCFISGFIFPSPIFQLMVSTYQDVCTLNCSLVGSQSRKQLGQSVLEQVHDRLISFQ